MGSKERFYVDVMAVHPEVTGSCNLVIVKYPDGMTTRFIVDCGIFQEKEFDHYNEDLPFDAQNIEFCLVTHNHVDHIGRLPLLVRNGFEGKIYSTSETACFAGIALSDSYKVLKDVAKRKHSRELYSEMDTEKAKKMFKACQYEETVQVDPRIRVTFLKNGHLIGAAIILVQISYWGCEDINLLFTGDYNNKNVFFNVPTLPKWVLDLPITVVQESTYGTMESKEIERCFEDNILRYMATKGTAVCMAFSLGRAQEVLYVLKNMQQSGKLDKDVPIYFDGKLAHQYTKLYLEADLAIREEMKDFLPENLVYVDKSTRRSVVESTDQKIIVTTSGMGTYGPAQQYIPEYIARSNCLLQFTGYTAEGTLGSRLKNTETNELVTIGSIIRKKRAEVSYTTEFSAHAKADEMIEFLRQFQSLKLVLVNHGESDVKIRFAKRIVEELDPKCVAIMNRTYFFRIGSYGLIRQLSTKFH